MIGGPLTLTVHRAAHEIGGNCIELALGDHRILLDAGSPLDAAEAPASEQIPKSLDIDTNIDGVVISHPHQDHYGLLAGLPPSWPVWAGGPSEALMRLTASLTGGSIRQPVHRFDSFVPFSIGPFRITPLLTDHSAFDAHMLLIEAGGRRVLYSGDFRRTGRKAVLVDRVMANPPRDVDVLLLEGTTLGRTTAFPTERELEDRFLALFNEAKGRVFITWSAQNIDRTVSIYRASRRAGRTLFLDAYSLDVLDQLSAFRDSLPRLGLPGIHGVITKSMARLYGSSGRVGRPEFVERIVKTGRCIGAARLASESRAVIMLRPSLMRDFQHKGLQLRSDDAWVFSQWSGYLSRGGYPEIKRAFTQAGAAFHQIHTSGHAHYDDLLALAARVNAKALVPIHSFDWDSHAGAFPRVLRLRDGERHVVA